MILGLYGMDMVITVGTVIDFSRLAGELAPISGDLLTDILIVKDLSVTGMSVV